jgi:hypothetical protein
MAINFPNSPTNGQTVTIGGVVYSWNSTTSTWDLVSSISTLDELQNVNAPTPSDNNLLAYDSGTSNWTNQTAAQAGVATATHTHPQSDVTNLTSDLASKVSNTSFYAGGKNVIINGAMDVAQRSTSFTFGTGGGNRYYAVDRWWVGDYTWSAGSNVTVSQDTSVPTNVGLTKSLKFATGASGLTLASGGTVSLTTIIEGYDASKLYGQITTVSFWVRSSVTGTYGITFTNDNLYGGPTRVTTQEYTINSANTWEKKTMSLDMASAVSSGTWNTTNGSGLSLSFMLGTASDRTGNTYKNVWGTPGSYFFNTSTATQFTAVANATFFVTGVQIEIGSVATPFSRAAGTLQGELAACQRYYYRVTANSLFGYCAVGNAYTTTNARVSMLPPVNMRVTPTAVDFSGVTLQDGIGGNFAPTSVTIPGNVSNSQTCIIEVQVASGLTAFRPMALGGNNNGAHFIGISAEL